MRSWEWLLFWRTRTRKEREAFERTLAAIRSLPVAAGGDGICGG